MGLGSTFYILRGKYVEFTSFISAVEVLWPVFVAIILTMAWLFRQLGAKMTQEQCNLLHEKQEHSIASCVSQQECNRCREQQNKYIALQVSQIEVNNRRIETTLADFRAEVKKDLCDLQVLIIDTIKTNINTKEK